MNARIALVTADEYPLTDDDRLLLRPMQARGMDPVAIPWSDRDIDWTAFDAIVIRSPWDYFEKPASFARWIEERAADGSRVWNPASVLRWNMRKDYLKGLAAAGVTTVETEWVGRGARDRIADIIDERGWDSVVIKPTVSGGAWKTHRLDGADPSVAFDVVDEHDVMVQPFLEEIVDEGEWSLMFFGGAFAGAILKRPAAGDYRVQERHGGSTVHIPDPPRDLIDQAAATLEHAPGELLYARVDGIRRADRLVLIELEVLEPALFFGMLPGGADRFTDALAARL